MKFMGSASTGGGETVKRFAFLLVCFLLLVSFACAQTVEDYFFVQGRIREMEEKYGVRILAGPEATILYTDYDLAVGEAAYEPTLFQRMLHYELDPEAEFLTTLNRLENALGSYPAGFFDRFDPCLKIHLTGKISLKGGEGSVAGFCDAESGETRLYICVDALPRTFHHELWHALEIGGNLSFADWNSLNPEGFEYTDDPDIQYNFDDDWFYWYYSAMRPGEDRATVFEALFMEDASWWDAHPHIRRKLDAMLEAAGLEQLSPEAVPDR